MPELPSLSSTQTHCPEYVQEGVGVKRDGEGRNSDLHLCVRVKKCENVGVKMCQKLI